MANTSNKFTISVLAGMNNTTWTAIVGNFPQGLAAKCHIFNPDSSDPISVATDVAGVSGTLTGSEAEPYTVGASTNKFKVDVDGAASPQTVTFTTGVNSALDIANALNAQTTGLTASVVSNRVKITSDTVGTTSQIDIQTVANNAYTALGFTVASNSGIDAQAFTILFGTDFLIEISESRPGFSYGEVICYVKGAGDQPIITLVA